MERSFLLVFENLCDITQKSVAGPFLAESPEVLAAFFKLQKRTPQGCSATYWDGKTGDVVIYIILSQKYCINTPEDLQKVVHKLHCDWY